MTNHAPQQRCSACTAKPYMNADGDVVEPEHCYGFLPLCECECSEWPKPDEDWAYDDEFQWHAEVDTECAVTPYYSDDACTIYHGDMLDVLPGLKADAVISDPPYGIGIRYGEGREIVGSRYWTWFTGALDLMRDAAPVVAFTHRVAALHELSGWDWVAVWNKPMSCGTRVGNSPVLPHWEPIFLYGVHSIGVVESYFADVVTVNPERATTGGKRGIKGGGWADEPGKSHPTPKPLSLYRRLVSSFSPLGGTVLDPFMGSGTTLRAAKDLGRKAIGIEIEERYCEIAAKKLAQGVLAL